MKCLAAVVLCLLILLASCGRSQEPPEPEIEKVSQAESAGDTGQNEIQRRPYPNSLTPEEMMEDYEYLWEALRTSYPYLPLAQRMGVDVDQSYEKRKATLENGKVQNDKLFMTLLASVINDFNGLGHLFLVQNYDGYTNYIQNYESLLDGPHCRYIYDVLTNPKVREMYEAMAPEINPDHIQYQPEDIIERNAEYNIEMDILEEGQIAYIKIRSFGGPFIEYNAEPLLSFMKEVSSYVHLIIDVTDNGGGSTAYWQNLLVSPNIDKPIDYTSYHILADTPLIREYHGCISGVAAAQPVDQLPSTVNLSLDDLAFADLFLENPYTIAPQNGDKLFQGKIWLLVNENCYSSTELFAYFCKATGFATLVGANTGGGLGGGVDPFCFSLPNSHYVIRFDSMLGINPDGSNNEEFGTTPDILAPIGAAPLDICLEAIEKGNY